MDRVGVGPRALAAIVDSLIFVIIGCCVGVVLAIAIGGGEFDSTDTEDFLVNSAFSLVGLAYFILMEGTSGTTLGKRVLKLKVVTVDGSPITMRDSVIRNVLRIVDVLPILYLVGAILIWTSPNKQRLGDRLAGTIVVRDVPRTDTYEPPFPSAPEQRF